MRLVGVLLLAVSLSGCVSELLTDEDVTVRTFSCAVLDPHDERPVLLELHRERGVSRVPLDAMSSLSQALVAGGVGSADRFAVREGSLLDGPSPWDAGSLAAWAEDAPVLEADEVRLHVLWVSAFDDGDGTVRTVAPGVVAVSEAAVGAGAVRLERSEDFLARVLLWHVVGHALGAVNQGIPLNGTDPSVQEGPAGHEPDVRSVMAAGWDHVASLPRTNATYDAFSEDVLDDWRAAAMPGGVCA